MTFRAPDLRKHSTYIGRMFGDTDGAIDNLRPPFTCDPEGINLYLRLGTVRKLINDFSLIKSSFGQKRICEYLY